MNALLTILLVLTGLVLGVGIALRIRPAQLGGVEFRETSVEHARFLVSQYAAGTMDGRFGYPSGFFAVNDKKSVDPNVVVLQEAHPSGAVSDGCAASVTAMMPGSFEAGCLGGAFMVAFLGVIASPFYAVSIFDRLCRSLLRSKVVVRLRTTDGNTAATFSFHGISGYLVMPKYRKAFAAPALPEMVFPSLPAEAAHVGS